jgi:hypothetical protein
MAAKSLTADGTERFDLYFNGHKLHDHERVANRVELEARGIGFVVSRKAEVGVCCVRTVTKVRSEIAKASFVFLGRQIDANMTLASAANRTRSCFNASKSRLCHCHKEVPMNGKVIAIGQGVGDRVPEKKEEALHYRWECEHGRHR